MNPGRGGFLIRKTFQILMGACSRGLLLDPTGIQPPHQRTCVWFGAGRGPLVLSKIARTFGIGGSFLSQVLPCRFESLKYVSADPKALQVPILELNRTA